MTNKELTNKELAQINKIEDSGNIVFQVIEVEGFKCAVVDKFNGNCVEVIPFNEHRTYPRQHAVLEWSFVRKNLKGG